MHEIVKSREYTSQEKRFRAIAQLERLLETVVEFLPQEHQVLVHDVLSLYERVW